MGGSVSKKDSDERLGRRAEAVLGQGDGGNAAAAAA